MISAVDFFAAAEARGLSFLTGVPCSFLTPFINAAISSPSLRYVGATSEGEAVGIAAGAWLAGKMPVVMCQNSGLGNMVNPLTSLNYPFRIPVLLIVTWRGEPGLADEPQHELMGEITHALLGVMRIPHRPFPKEASDIAPTLDAAMSAMGRGIPFALVMEKGSVADEKLNEAAVLPVLPPVVANKIRGEARPTRLEVLKRIHDAGLKNRAAVIASTGKGGRELFTIADTDNQLYQVGSMGCASAMGLGLALNHQGRVIVVDGDGAALMKLGNLATIGAQRPDNLIHVILDNGVHDSTGGQSTVSAVVRFADVAAACGYRTGSMTDDADAFAGLLGAALSSDGPHLIHCQIAAGSIDKLARPTVRPPEVARRLQKFLAGG